MSSESNKNILTKDKIEKLNQYIARVEVLLLHLDDVIPMALDDEEYRENDLLNELKYAKKRIKIIRDTKKELKEIFN